MPPVLRLAHVTDAHLSAIAADPGDTVEFATRHGDGTDAEAALRLALGHAARRGAALALVTGDVTDHGTVEELRRYAACAAGAGIPVRAVPGNHDHYGHRHEPGPDDRPRGGGFLGSCTVGRWEAVIGPRWWSMDLAGLHLLGLDWFSALCGVDLDAQLAFAEADLGRLERGTPVLVLSHDQPDEGWLDHLRGVAPGVRLAGVLTGHCHAPKTVAAADGCLHVSTGSSTVGGLDWSPPQLRLLEWDGATLSAGPPERPHPPPPGPSVFPAPEPGWPVWEVGAGQHLGAVVPCGDRLLVPVVEADLRSGAVVALDPAGGPQWRHRLDGAPVTGLATDGDAVVAVGLGGELRCLSASDGGLRWRHHLGDPLRSRVLAAPVLAPGGLVVAGDLWGVAAHDLQGGRRRWIRHDLGPVDTLMTYGTGVATSSSVVLPFGGPHRGLTGLALADGAVEWTDPPRTPPPLSSVVEVGGGDAVVVRDGPLVERFALATGEVRWRAPLQGRFSTAAPLHREGTLTVVTGDGVLHRLDARSGEVLQRRHLDGVRPGYGPYRTRGTGAPTRPVAAGTATVVVLIDGSVWALAGGADDPRLLGDLGTEVTAQPAAFAGGIAAVDTRGRVHLLATDGGPTGPAPTSSTSRRPRC